MTRAIWLRRVVFATLISTAILTTFPVAQTSASLRREGSTATPTSGTDKLCPIDWRRSTWHVKRLIECAAAYYHVNHDTALSIAYRESRYEPTAYNSWSCAKGLYQHLCRYWPDRADDYGFRNWSAFNARANIFVTMRMVKRYGWEPWGG